MPGRNIPLITNQIYHTLNRGISSQLVFLNQKDYQRFLKIFLFYQNVGPPISYSAFSKLSEKAKEELLRRLNQKRQFLVEIIAFCLMPSHFHFLLKQVQDGGVSLFMSQVSNSFTRYFNTSRKRIGPLLQGKFKAVPIETDEQLLHTSRYIHLNPYSSKVVNNLKDLENYSHSSFPEYLNLQKTDNCQKNLVLDQFKNPSEYKKFVLSQADYQRRLEESKTNL